MPRTRDSRRVRRPRPPHLAAALLGAGVGLAGRRDVAALVLQGAQVEHAAQLGGQVAGRRGPGRRSPSRIARDAAVSPERSRSRASVVRASATTPARPSRSASSIASEATDAASSSRRPPSRARACSARICARSVSSGCFSSSSRASVVFISGSAAGVGDDRHRGLHPQQPQPGVRVRVGRGGPQLVAGQGQGPVGLAGGERRLARLGRQVDHVDAVDVGVGGQLERELVVPGGLVGAAHGHRLVAGRDAGADRGREVVGRPGVPGQLGGGAADPALLQRLGVGRVQPHPLAGQQVVVDRLGEQGVPEGVAVAADRHQHVALDGRAQRRVERAGLAVDDRGRAAGAGPGGRPRRRRGRPAGRRRRAGRGAPAAGRPGRRAARRRPARSRRPAPRRRTRCPRRARRCRAASRSGSGAGVQRPDQGADVVVGQRPSWSRLTPGSRDHSATAGAAGGGGAGRRCGRTRRSPPGRRSGGRTGS